MILKNKRVNSLIFMGLIASLVLFSTVNSAQGIVKAQTETMVKIEPESKSIIINDTTSIDIQVMNGLNINAFDLKIVYNPNILYLESWSLGDYLSNLGQVKKEQAPGSLRLVYTQLATPPVSGDGILLQLVFFGLAVGNAPVTFETVSFADSAGILIYPERSDGVIIVQSNVSPTFTPTITPTLTRTPTQTGTQSPEPSETGSLPTLSETLTATMPEVTFTNTPEITETVTEQSNTTETQIQDNNGLVSETALVVSSPLDEDNLSNSVGEETHQDPISVENTNETKSETINKFLWALLISFILIIAIMILILIKRKKTEHLKEW